MNNDMLPAGMTANVKPEDIEWKGGDLINRDALKRALNYIYDCAYIDSKSKEGIASDIIAEIDKAPAVDISGNEYFPYRTAYFNGVEDGRATARPKGEWINHRNDYGHNIADCSLCGKAMQWHDEDEDGIPRYCWYCGASMKGGAT